MRDMEKLTHEEILEIMCAPAPADEPEESDFVADSETEEKANEAFIKNWIARELN
jgi:hypothetical protein